MSQPSENLKTLLAAAVEIGDAQERDRYMQQACRGDTALQAELRSMVRDYFAAGSLFDRPAAVIPLSEFPADASIGERIGLYTLRECLGEGGMGIVYVAEQDRPVRRKVALKIIKPGMDSRAVISRFEAERQALALMDHPNIAKVFDAGTTHSGRPYFVMELVRGEPITEHCDAQRLSTRERLQLFQQVCRAIQHAHQKGIVHRDLKPSNVIVAMHDTTPVVKVIDFGVAKALDQPLTEGTLYTGFGQMIGTPLYMSPEQAGQSSLEIDTRSDVYALGIMLYELLTGSTPFESETLKIAGFDEMRRMIREVEPPRPSARVRTLAQDTLSTVSQRRQIEPRQMSHHLRGELDWIVMKAIEKDRNRRYPTANALAADIGRYLSDVPIEACPPTNRYLLAKFARRHRLLLSSLGTIMIVLVAATAVSVWQAHVARQSKRLADERLASERVARQEVLQRELDLRRQLYVSDIKNARAAWSNGDCQRAHQLLHRHVPTADSPTDLREFTWHYLAARCSSEGVTLNVHDAPVLALAVSPDDRFVASSDRNGQIRIWDRTAGSSATNWNYSNKEVNALAFSPDGTTLATAGQDRTVRLWKVDDWHEIACLRGHTMTVCSVAWSSDGRLLASGARDGSVRIWDPTKQSEVTSFSQHEHDDEDVVHCVAWSPDGSRLAVAVGPAVQLWRTADWSLQSSVRSFSQSIQALAFDPHGKWLAGGGYTWSMVVWDVATGIEAVRTNVAGTIWSVAFSPDSEFVLAGLGDGGPSIWRWHGADRKLEFVHAAFEHTGRQRGVVFADRGRALLTASEEDARVRQWDFENQLGCRPMAFDGDCLLVLRDKPWAAIASSDGTITLRDQRTGEEKAVLSGISGTVVKAVVDSSERFLAAAGSDRQLSIWEIPSGKRIAPLALTSPSYDDLAFAPHQSVLAVSSDLGGIELWDAEAEQLRQRWTPDAKGIYGVAFSADGSLLAATGNDVPCVYLWDVRRGELARTLTADQRMYHPHFSPDGDRLLVGGRTNGTLIWDVHSGAEIGRLLGHRGGVWNLAISPDGKTLVTFGTDETIRSWHLPTGEELCTLLQTPQSRRANPYRWLHFASPRTLLVGAELGQQQKISLRIFDAE